MFKERALEGLSIETRKKLNKRGALEREEIFGKDINIPEAIRYVSDRETFNVLMNMVRDVDVRKYKTVGSDETAGRIPTLFCWEFMNIKRKEMGMPRLNNVFFWRNKSEVFLDNFISERRDTLGNVLLVTELIRNGTGTVNFGEMFRKYGVYFDVLSVSSVVSGVPEQLEYRYGNRVFVGENQLLGTGEVFHRRSFSGVASGYGDYKDGGESAHPKKLEKDKFDPGELFLSRKVIRIMAREAAKII